MCSSYWLSGQNLNPVRLPIPPHPHSVFSADLAPLCWGRGEGKPQRPARFRRGAQKESTHHPHNLFPRGSQGEHCLREAGRSPITAAGLADCRAHNA